MGILKEGDRVQTRLGVGVVVYRRMAGLSYCEVEAYSVRLDFRVNDLGYTGTMFPAVQVRLLELDREVFE